MLRKGLSLVETIVVIAVIVTLIGISVPVFGKFRGKADSLACQENLRTLGGGLEFYLQDNNSRMPEISITAQQSEEGAPEEEVTLRSVLTPYVDKVECFHCPADDEIFALTGCSYGWNSLINDQHRANLNFLGNKEDLTSLPVIFDIEAFHGEKNGTNFLYADYSSNNRVTFKTTP